jgi:hypothetical protein
MGEFDEVNAYLTSRFDEIARRHPGTCWKCDRYYTDDEFEDGIELFDLLIDTPKGTFVSGNHVVSTSWESFTCDVTNRKVMKPWVNKGGVVDHVRGLVEEVLEDERERAFAR